MLPGRERSLGARWVEPVRHPPGRYLAAHASKEWGAEILRKKTSRSGQEVTPLPTPLLRMPNPTPRGDAAGLSAPRCPSRGLTFETPVHRGGAVAISITGFQPSRRIGAGGLGGAGAG